MKHLVQKDLVAGLGLGFGGGGVTQYQLLPKYLLPSDPVLLEDFENINDWSVNETVKANAVDFKSGNQSMKISPSAGGASYMTKTVAWDLSSVHGFRLWVYIHDTTDKIQIQLQFATNTTLTKFYRWDSWLYVQPGWNNIDFPASSVVAVNTPGPWSSIVRLRIIVQSAVDVTSVCSIDSLSTVYPATPAAAITFDDGILDTYTLAYPYLKSKNIKATAYIITDEIGSNGYMTAAQIKELADAGWTIGSHSKTHTGFTVQTEAEQEYELNASRDALLALGITSEVRHVAYPYGAYNNDTLTAMAATGMLTGRTTFLGNNPIIPYGNLYQVSYKPHSGGRTMTEAKSMVNTIKSRGETNLYGFHSVSVANSGMTWWPYANFTEFIDYLVSQKIPTLTIDEWYKLHSESISVRVQ